ncbi:beta strand repeat-containing protein [Burkholderia vietnamiensis]|uniref:beta strand repeat-containing protein n=1 Tax=Burkholderia vietnamiensis TaxID=60552 RepID=UPI0012D9FE5A|nr:hypothetical protein [Burkholderia vietnamiensis]
MKTEIALLGLTAMLVGAPVSAQFNSGQVLKATDLNTALASPTITGGTINGSVIGGTNPKAATFTNLSVTGSLTATGLVTLPALATQAANTVVANVTGSTASPTAFAMPSCSGANNALRWTSGTGFACASSIALTSSGLNQFASTTSSQLASIVSDETGTGSLVFAASPSLTGNVNMTGTTGTALQVTGSGSTHLVNLTDTGVNGSNITLIGNGATTPSKTIRAQNGSLGVVNDAYSAQIFTLTDGGSLTATGGLNGTAVGNVTASTGAFTTLGASGATTLSGPTSVTANGVTLTVSNANNTDAIDVYGTTGSNGAILKLIGNGSTTPSKTLQSANGKFQIINDGFTSSLLTLNENTTAAPVAAIGSSLYPTVVAPVSTTATSTNGSTSITVTSASGIAVGMGIYSGFVSACSIPNAAFQNAYVTNVSGTTITMSCPATSSAGGSVQFGQQRYSTTSSVIANDVGTQTLKVGSASQGNSAAWLDQVSAGQDYRMSSAAQIVAPPGGGYGLTIAARSSDATGGAPAFPLQSFLYLDSWPNTNYASENVYLQDNLSAATAGHAQPHIQMEQSINSLWGSPPAEDPFSINQTNQTIAHRYDCGTGQSTTAGLSGCTTAIDIVPNPQTFQNGIVIANNAIDTGGGTRQGTAMSMPTMVGVTWFSAASTYSAAVYSPSAGVLGSYVPSGGQFNFVVNGNTSASINATGLNGTPVGQSSAASGSFTTLNASGLITPSTTSGIKGTAAADNANAGSVGEYISSTVTSGSAVSLTSGTSANITSLALTPGDWDVWGIVGTSPAGSTAQSYVAGGVSTTSATLPGVTSGATAQAPFTAVTGAGVVLPVGRTRINVSSNTTVYLVATSNFTGSSNAAYGGLFARRSR